ncbi:putative glutathione S-transferase DHAR1, cytosolic [Schistosoma japonicum]|nr:putative glutathione S-transferase DHAR1, cytosolic [Schistosoma japonicum]
MMHLKNGDPEPSINPARYTLFAYGFCPFCERVRLTLSFHKIDYDLILVSLLIKPDWLVKYSPMGKVPLLIHHGEKLLESDLIMRFIDELHGEKTSLMTFFGPGHSILYETDLNESDVVQFYEACSELENSLKSKYFTGDQLSLADLVLFPLIDYFEVVILSVIHNIELDHVHELKMSDALNEANKWPNLVNYLTTMRQESFVVNIRKSTRIKAKYASSKRAGCPNPEIQ